MPNGYGLPIRIFTKLSKVLFEHLRSQGYNSVVYEADHIFKKMRISLALLTF